MLRKDSTELCRVWRKWVCCCSVEWVSVYSAETGRPAFGAVPACAPQKTCGSLSEDEDIGGLPGSVVRDAKGRRPALRPGVAEMYHAGIAGAALESGVPGFPRSRV